MEQSPLPSFAEICTSRSRLLCRSKWWDLPPLSSRAPEGASVHGGAVAFLKSVAPPHGSVRVPSTSGPQHYAAGPVVSEGRPSARRGPGLEIQGPQCAFETSMFMCPAVHMSTRNLLRSSSTHEPSDPPFRVVSLFLPTGKIIGQVRSPISTWRIGVRSLGRHARTQPVKRGYVIVLGAARFGGETFETSRGSLSAAGEIGFKLPSHRSSLGVQTPVTPGWWL